MEYTKEFLAGMYGAYLGANVIHADSYERKLIGIDNMNTYALGYNIVKPAKCPITISKLALTPLSDITDEDAIEVAKIISLDSSVESFNYLYNQIKLFFKQEDEGCYYFLDAYMVHPRDQLRCMDYLRSKGYDMGYQDVSSLIEDGLAVNINTLKEPCTKQK